jgi:predicted DNA-binding transcriptional regulator AlpA
VTPRVNTEDLVDAQGVAELLGLSHPNSVITYLRRYEDFPRPVIDLGERRVKLWSRKSILVWRRTRRRPSD